LIGIWNIHKYEIYDNNGNEIDTKVSKTLEEYISTNVLGGNFFKINTTELSKNIARDLSYVESVRIEKTIPNKIVLFANIYTPKLIAILKDSKCLLLSEKGYLLEELCTDSEENCCLNYAEENSLYTLSSQEIDVAKLENGKSRLLIMEDIHKIVKAIEVYKYEIKNITFKENILTIVTTNEKTFTFTFSSDIEIQMQRLVVVMSKIAGDGLKFKSLDLRFERPVMKN